MTDEELDVVFADATLERAFHRLKRSSGTGHKRLAESIAAALDELRRRHREGRVIPMWELPAFYVTAQDREIRRLDIRSHWRVFYTVEPDRIVILDLTGDGLL